MGDFFDTMTIVVVIIMVFLVLVIAIHASARLVQMTFGRKSGLKQKDTAKSNEAVKNAEPVNLPEQKKNRPALMSDVPFTKKNTLLVNRWQSGHRSVSSRRMPV
ncbi:hypothetical protein NXY32_18025 [Bacteroides fragilis]|nr:hypothetical protein [Bacteroides fragilis]